MYARQVRPEAAMRSTARLGADWKQSVQSVVTP